MQAFRRLVQTIGHDRFCVVIAGDGDMRPEIEARLGALSPHVHLLGRVPPEAMPALVANCDVAVTASEKETRGLTVIEALGCGLPVVAPRAGGVQEDIKDGHNSFLYPPKDETAFVGRILVLVGDESLRRRMGECGKRSVAHLGWHDAVGRLVMQWQQLIDQKQGALGTAAANTISTADQLLSQG